MRDALLEKIKTFAETFYPVQMRQLIVEIDMELKKPQDNALLDVAREMSKALEDVDQVLASGAPPDAVEVAWCRTKIAKALDKAMWEA